ncbi:MAG: MBL fold metallo-hydrolase [Defluviitaleaceae bacterium]|nr:MBL fold metallo-hydrolase [Defluviitaleaceae bacterium]
MRIAENIKMLPIGGQGVVNLVLAWDDANLVLIDAGFPGQIGRVVAAVEEAGFAVERLTHLIITHQDWDHIGCINDLQKLAPNMNVISHETEAPYIDGRKTPIKLAARLADYENLSDEMKKRCDMQNEFHGANKITVHQTVTDGDILPVCGGLEVVHTPGHTPGHIVVLFRESRIMAVGDAANIKDGSLIGPNPVHTFDMPLAETSLEKIKSFNPKGVVAYHGGFLEM